MKKIIIIAYILISIKSYGQQDPMNTMFAYNKLQTNPAYAGGKDILSIRAVYRYQWTKLAGAPQTANINIHAPLKNERIGLGLSVINDRLGVTNQNWLMMSFAYRLPFKNDTKLSFGLSGGMYLYNIRVSDLAATDIGDPLAASDFKGTSANVGSGIYYYGTKFYVGIASPNLIPYKYRFDEKESNDINSKQIPHLFIMGGYTFEMGENKNFWIQPQILLKYIMATNYKVPFESDINLTFTFHKMFNFGVTYRSSFGNKFTDKESIDLMTMLDTKKGFSIGYSYDITLSKINSYENGSHEVMLGYDIDVSKKGFRTPRYF
jgi:type IX secretion system PorP/SprF family membrane protein